MSIVCSTVIVFFVASLINLTIDNSISRTDFKKLGNTSSHQLPSINQITVSIPLTISKMNSRKYQVCAQIFAITNAILDRNFVDFVQGYVEIHYLGSHRKQAKELCFHLDTIRKVSCIHKSAEYENVSRQKRISRYFIDFS